MRRPDHGHVAELAYDLVRLKGVWNVDRDLPASLPAGAVTARLAVLWASTVEPTLMCGSLSHKPAEKVAHAKELLNVGVDAWEELDLDGDLDLPVRCGRVRHTVRLTRDDELEALSHPDLDVESERVAASFGGELLPCLREVDQAHAEHVAPGTRTRREHAIRAGELFAFVRRCRRWLRAGFDVASASPALMTSMDPEQLQHHTDVGMSVDDAIQWRSVTAEEAVRWVDVGFNVADRDLWCGQGRTLDQARLGVEISGGPHALLRWARVSGDKLEVKALAEWARERPPTGVWSEVAAHGLTVADVQEWTARGFLPVDILTYAQRGVRLEDALPWVEHGYNAYVATGFMKLGIAVEDAYAMRSQPARQVQALWPRLRSVAAVLAELERT